MADIDGVLLDGLVYIEAAHNGYKVSKNKIWSRDTGRNDNGDMVGTIVNIKTKVEITSTPMSLAHAQEIDDILSNIDRPFIDVNVLYIDGTIKTITCYTGDIEYSFYSLGVQDGIQMNGLQISFIQQ